MQKKTVLITGITSEIGFITAKIFAENNWKILGQYHSNNEKAYIVKDEIEKKNGTIELFQVDLSSESQLENFSSQINKIEIHTLVNNAGTYIVSKHFSELSFEELQKTFMVNTFTPIKLSSAIFEKMKKMQFGRIINISSIASKYGGSSFSMHYGASKSALEAVTKTLAKEGSEYNILVNTIRPGVIDTDFHKKFPKDMTKRIEMIPLKKMGQAKDIAQMIYYLGSDANEFITNEIITISGGE